MMQACTRGAAPGVIVHKGRLGSCFGLLCFNTFCMGAHVLNQAAWTQCSNSGVPVIAALTLWDWKENGGT